MRNEFDYIIVGAGLCGLSLAKELSLKNKKILILERGTVVKRMGKLLYVPFFYDRFGLLRSTQGVIIYRTFGIGGTTIACCGNAVTPPGDYFDKLGIDFSKELQEATNDCGVTDKGFPIGPASRKIMEASNSLGYAMHPMPKFGPLGRCIACGDCELGCRPGAKWTAVEFLKYAKKENITIVPGFMTKKIIISNGEATGVRGSTFGSGRKEFFGNRIILSAGGIGTPIILQNSGVAAGDNLFVDLFNMTYGIAKEFRQRKELCMSVVCTQFHEKDGFVLSPFIDNPVGFLSCADKKDMAKAFSLKRMLGIMGKINDDSQGKVYANGRIDKAVTPNDSNKLKKAAAIASEILIKCGVEPGSIIVTRPRGAHPGGTAGIGRVVNKQLETAVKRLFVCDASVFPVAPGLPPMLTLISLTKWFANTILER